MRLAGIAAVSLALALALAGAAAGGGGEERAAPGALGVRLDALCERARLAVEALGKPRDEGGAVLRPWAAIGGRFVADVRRLDARSPRDRNRLRRLADDYAGFYESLRLGHGQWAGGASVALEMSLQRAYALLARAEATAARLGAPACARRPFDDA